MIYVLTCLVLVLLVLVVILFIRLARYKGYVDMELSELENVPKASINVKGELILKFQGYEFYNYKIDKK